MDSLMMEYNSYIGQFSNEICLFTFQYWNRLSSLQRSIICMVIILGTLGGIYVFPTIYNDYMAVDDLDAMSRKNSQRSIDMFGKGAHQTRKSSDDVNKFAKNAIENIKKKAIDHLNKQEVCIVSHLKGSLDFSIGCSDGKYKWQMRYALL